MGKRYYKSCRWTILFVSILLIFVDKTVAQQWSGIIATNRAIDWSNVGAQHINDVRTQCTTTACNTVSGGTVTQASLTAALASASSNEYVLIPSGTFNIAGSVAFPNNISNLTLRGSGSNSTFLVWTANSGSGLCNGSNGAHDICITGVDNSWVGSPSNTASWTGTNGASGTYTAGATSITLSNTANLTVGNYLILDQIDTQSDNGALYVGCELPADTSSNCYTGTSSNGNERGYAGPLSVIRGQQQMVTVTSISGTTVGISPGVYASNYATAQSPGAWWPTSPVQNDGVENLSMDHTNGGDGVSFYNCQGCWVKGVRSIRNSNTGTAWCHVCFSIANKGTVRDSYFYGYSADTYGITMAVASDDLIENNIFQYYIATELPNSDCEGCVWGYNYQPGSWNGSTSYMGQSAEYHGVTLFILSEGNIGAGINADSFHGTHVLDTDFRNRWSGREMSDGNVVTTNTVAVRLQPGTRYQNVIGNILGTIGYHTVYQSNLSGSNISQSVIGCGAYPEGGMAGDTLTCPTSMFWGNWDNVTNAARFNSSEVPSGLSSYANPVPATHTLPASFYYSSKPSWWPASKPWPIIGPDVTGGDVGQCTGGTYSTSTADSSSQCTGGTFATVGGFAYSNPAMDCYLTTMNGPPNGTGSALTFNSSACYSSTPAAVGDLLTRGTAIKPGVVVR